MTKISRRRALAGIATGAAAGVLPAGAFGQGNESFPNRPIKIICSSPAGGGVDAASRLVADLLLKQWGQPVTVENRTGGSNNIAAEIVAKSDPDGYTLLATPPNTVTVNAVLFNKLNYDPTALEPVSIMVLAPNVLTVRKDLPAKTVKELIALAGGGRKLSYASQGNGSTSHLTAELFAARTGAAFTHVPYRGTAPAMNDLAGGHVDLIFSDMGSILPLHQGGQVRIIAACTLKRLPEILDVPTIDESGVAGFASTTFYSLMAPPKTPAAVRAKLNDAIRTLMKTPEAQAKLSATYVTAGTLDLDEAAAYLKGEAKLWSDVVKAANITVEQ